MDIEARRAKSISRLRELILELAKIVANDEDLCQHKLAKLEYELQNLRTLRWLK